MLMISLMGLTSIIVAACVDKGPVEGDAYPADCFRFDFQGVQSMPDAQYLPRNVAYAAGETRVVPIEGEGAEGLELVETAVEGIVTMDEVAQTRGALTTQDNFAAINKQFSIFACKNGSGIADYIYNEKVKPDGTMVKPMRWSKGDAASLTFYAIHPAIENEDLDATSGRRAKFKFKVNSDASKQVDLLMAGTADLKFDSVKNKVVPINFTHTTTAIQFKIGSDFSYNQKIKTIEILNVKGEGVYDAATRKWTLRDGQANFKLSFDPAYPTAQRMGTIINPGEGLFFMLPQELSEQAMVKITFESGKYWQAKIGNKDKDGNAPKWIAGMTKTYTVANSKDVQDRTFVLSVGAKVSELTYDKPTALVEIKSYRHLMGRPESDSLRDRKEAWVIDSCSIGGITYKSTEDINKKIRFDKTQDNRVADVYKVTLDPEYIDFKQKRDTELKQAVSPSGRKDLSLTAGGWRETANCYIVSAPGEYKFPAVYGNAKKGGSNNSVAYNPGTGDGNFLSKFVSGKGEIDGPDITEGNKVVVLWQSVPGLVSVKGISANGGADRYINFSVDRTKIQEASAIIGLQNGNTVYWSWHIWITSPEVASVDKGCFMREPIGFRHTKWMKTTYDKDREVKVYFKQRRSGAQATLILTQKPHEEVSGIALYYQQGRKDPLYVGGPFSLQKQEINSGMMLIHAAQLPLKMARPRMLTYHPSSKSNWDWCAQQGEDNTYFNLWDAKNNVGYGYTGQFIKTVYDPCPAGFRVPRSGDFEKIKSGNNGKSALVKALGRINPRLSTLGIVYADSGFYWSSEKMEGDRRTTFYGYYGVYGLTKRVDGKHKFVGAKLQGETQPLFTNISWGQNVLPIKEE